MNVRLLQFALLTLCPIVLQFGCLGPKEPNPDIRYLLDIAKADSRYDDLYRQLRESVKTPSVSIWRSREKGSSLENLDAAEYNPLVPGAKTYDSKIVVSVEGSEWSYEAIFYFTETNSIAAVSYMRSYCMPRPIIQPLDWHMKWFADETQTATNTTVNCAQ